MAGRSRFSRTLTLLVSPSPPSSFSPSSPSSRSIARLRPRSPARIGPRTITRQNGCPGGVADPKLELPALGPLFRLFILADLDQNHVSPRLQRAVHLVLIEAHAAMVLL